jgi:hypothetical protein
MDRGFRYALALLACESAADEEGLARALPDLEAAFRLHAGPDKLARGILEARLLAGQTIEETAAACGLAPEAVRAYEALFFHVLGKLHSRMYILIQAVGGDLWGGGLTEDDVDVLLKLYGFLKGPIFLEWLIRYFRGGWSAPERLEDASIEQLQELILMLELRALIQARVLPFPECLRAERLWAQTRELQRHIDARSGNLQAAPGHASSEAAPADELLSPPGSDPEAWWLAWAEAEWRSAWAGRDRRAV